MAKRKKRTAKRRTRNPNSSKPHPSQVAPSPAWTLEKGVSYSLLSKFINCRERFRLYSVEGAREEKASKAAMDFGTYFHELLEIHAKKPLLSAESIIRQCKKGKVLSRRDRKVAGVLFNNYLWWYQESNYRYVDAEVEFDVMYRLPNGREIRLVGKTDEIPHAPPQYDQGYLWVQENKTKEKINATKIENSITSDLQSLLYATALQIHYGCEIGGIVYNVIRNPSQSPKARKMKKDELAEYKKKNPSSKATTVKETEDEFLERLNTEIQEDPKHYFMRWEMPFDQDYLRRWRSRALDPHLMQLCQWWDSVKHDPFSPWETPLGNLIEYKDAQKADEIGVDPHELVPNPHHWMRPFGVYDGTTTGTGEFFDYLLRGRRQGLSFGNPPHSELSIEL